MAARIVGIVVACVLIGGVGGFVAGRLVGSADGLTNPPPIADPLEATLVWRGVDGDLSGSMSVRSEIVDRCAKAPEMLRCMKDNYRLLVIDAENGSIDGMVATAISLTGSSHCGDLRRAASWLYKAHKLGKDISVSSRILREKAAQDRCPISL